MMSHPGHGPDLSGLKIEDRFRAAKGSWSKRLWFIGLPLLILLLAIGWFGLNSRSADVVVASARLVQGGGPATLLNASGYITPRRRATVAAKVTGRVEEVFAEEGMQVTAGQVLARLDDAEARTYFKAAQRDEDVAMAALRDLEVNLADAERERRRLVELRKADFASEQEVDRALTTVESLKARIALAGEQIKAAQARVAVTRQDLENCTVRAPFAGIVVSKDAQRGEMVSPVSAGGGFTRTGIATLVDMESLEIEVDVNEAYIARVTPGQRVEATLDAYPDWKIPSRVRTIIPTADRQKATVKVRISFDALDSRFLPDMGVKVAFLAPENRSAETRQVIVVPPAAVRVQEGKKVVFIWKDGVLERRAVATGSERGGEVELASGVQEGEQVVVEGPDDLEDGQKARIKR